MTGSPRPTLSVLVITLNEERLLGRALDSVRWADEIVVVDSGSTDRTEEIARHHTEHFFVRPYSGHGEQRRRSLEVSSGDWVLYIDADEVVTPELRASIERALADPGEMVGFWMRLHTSFLGQWFGTRGWRAEWKLRLFRRGHGRFTSARIHEGAVIEGAAGRLEGVLLHYPYRDLKHFTEKMNRYSTGMAEQLFSAGHRSSGLTAVGRGTARFLRDFVLGGDFLYGAAGLVRSALMGYYTFLKYVKLWELQLVDPEHDPPEPPGTHALNPR